MFVQRMFCNDKKKMTLSTTHSQNKSGVKDLVLFYNFFSVLLVIVDACLSRWKDVCLSFGTRREKLLWTKWTYDSGLMSESIMLSFFATGIDWAPCCVGMSACRRPSSILSVALCTSSYLTT